MVPLLLFVLLGVLGGFLGSLCLFVLYPLELLLILPHGLRNLLLSLLLDDRCVLDLLVSVDLLDYGKYVACRPDGAL